jgi:coenzyme F420-reducing hydrogenase delta subunit
MMMTRIFMYANKLLHLNRDIETITEHNKHHDNRHHKTRFIAACLVAMAFSRPGSFNSVELSRGNRAWNRLLGRGNAPCSADTLGRRSAQIDAESVRSLLLKCTRRMRRSKALKALRKGGYAAVVVDGHEVGCSYCRDFGDSPCLQREIDYQGGKRMQYYQRLVGAVLVGENHAQILDVEMQLPGEDEIAAALRLLNRIGMHYSNLFDVVMADGLYAQTPFFKAVRAMNKHVIAVLKDERRELTQDVRSITPITDPVSFKRADKSIQVEARDIEGLLSWPQAGEPVRVVHTRETRSVMRQARTKKTAAEKNRNDNGRVDVGHHLTLRCYQYRKLRRVGSSPMGYRKPVL